MARELTCIKCGGTFPRRETGSGSQRKICDECRKPKLNTHKCIACDKEFQSSKKVHLTCSPECYKVYDKMKTYAWREKNRERYRELCRKHNHTHQDKLKNNVA